MQTTHLTRGNYVKMTSASGLTGAEPYGESGRVPPPHGGYPANACPDCKELVIGNGVTVQWGRGGQDIGFPFSMHALCAASFYLYTGEDDTANTVLGEPSKEPELVKYQSCRHLSYSINQLVFYHDCDGGILFDPDNETGMASMISAEHAREEGAFPCDTCGIVVTLPMIKHYNA